MAHFKLLGASVVAVLSIVLVNAESHTVMFTNKSVVVVCVYAENLEAHCLSMLDVVVDLAQ